MRKKKDQRGYPKGSGLAVGLLIGVMFALVANNNGLFVLGVAIGAALETTYTK